MRRVGAGGKLSPSMTSGKKLRNTRKTRIDRQTWVRRHRHWIRDLATDSIGIRVGSVSMSVVYDVVLRVAVSHPAARVFSDYERNAPFTNDAGNMDQVLLVHETVEEIAMRGRFIFPITF